MFLTGTVLQALASLAPPDQDDAHPLYTAAQQDQFKVTVSSLLMKLVQHKKTLPSSGVGAGSLSLLHGGVNFMRALPDDQQDFFQDACRTLVSWPTVPHEVINSLYHALSGQRAERDVSPVRYVANHLHVVAAEEPVVVDVPADQYHQRASRTATIAPDCFIFHLMMHKQRFTNIMISKRASISVKRFTTGAVAADAAGAVGTSAWSVHMVVPAAVAALELLVAVEVVLAAALAGTFAKGPPAETAVADGAAEAVAATAAAAAERFAAVAATAAAFAAAAASGFEATVVANYGEMMQVLWWLVWQTLAQEEHSVPLAG